MEKPRLAGVGGKPPWPLETEFPANTAEEKLVEGWFLQVMKDRLEDRVAFLREELTRGGLEGKAVDEAVGRIKYGLLAPLMRHLLWDVCYSEGPVSITPEIMDEFFVREFGASLREIFPPR